LPLKSPAKASSTKKRIPNEKALDVSDEEDQKPGLDAAETALPQVTSRKVGDLPLQAQPKWKELVKVARVWFGEVENPWSIDNAAIDRVLPVLWTRFVGTNCQWDSVHATHRRVARNIVSRINYWHISFLLTMQSS
jgi:hypothetical protein